MQAGERQHGDDSVQRLLSSLNAHRSRQRKQSGSGSPLAIERYLLRLIGLAEIGA